MKEIVEYFYRQFKVSDEGKEVRGRAHSQRHDLEFKSVSHHSFRSSVEKGEKRKAERAKSLLEQLVRLGWNTPKVWRHS